jgi:hypothetical protein
MTTVTSATLFDNRTGTTSLHPVVYYTGSIFSLYVAGAAAITGPSAVANQWYHVAVSRVSASTKMFINGTQVGSTYADTNSYATSGTVGIGAGLSGGNIVTGYISNLRVIKGTGLYTSTFTPSTTPLTAIANTSLLTCQSTRMIDNSINAFTITANGDVKPRIFNPFGYTAQINTSYTPTTHGGSAFFDGTGDSLTTPNVAFDLTTTTWCIEYWIYPTTIASTTYYGLWALSTSGFRQGIYGDSGTHYLSVLNGGGGYGGFNLVANNKVIVTGAWQHIALTSDGTTIRQFYNSVLTSTGSAASFSASTPTVGSWGAGSYFTGYIADFRITKGSAIYTGNFIPPAQAVTNYSTSRPASLLLNFNKGGIVDQHGSNTYETNPGVQLSTSIKKYGNSSIYFNGSSYIAPQTGAVNNSNELYYLRGNFTVEAWVYTTSLAGVQLIVTFGTETTSRWQFFINTSGQLAYDLFNTGTTNYVGSNNVTINTWTHVAMVRSGSTISAYVNGVSQGTPVSQSSSFGNGPLSIGVNSPRTGGYFVGYMNELRITKGFARYTANFSTPTSALLGQ